MKKREVVLLVSAIALVICAFRVFSSHPAPSLPVHSSPSNQSVVVSPSVTEPPPLAVFSEVVSRPLFLPTRAAPPR